MKAIILAAGFGTRLYPLTKNIPKALLPLGEKTVLDFLIEKLDALEAVSEIILVTSSRFYIDFFKWRQTANSKKPIHIVENRVYVPEKRLGTVRDLHLALFSSFSGTDDFLVFCGDNYFDFPLNHFLLPILGHRREAFVGVYDVKDPSLAREFGVISTDRDNLITDFEERPHEPKSSKVSMGVYYLPSSHRLRTYEYLEIEKLNPDRIGDFFAWLSKRDRVYAVEFDGRWFDIGTLKSYEEAKKSLEKHVSS